MKVLVVSSLYPNNANLKHGIFVHHRMKQLRAHYPEIEIKVIAPVPWFPIASDTFGEYGRFAKAAAFEVIDGIEVYHPRYLVVPKVGMQLTPLSFARAIRTTAEQIKADGFDFEMIDGHYYYPDGVALERACRTLKVPFNVTARGTDINFIPEQSPAARQKIELVLQKTTHNLAVCKALMDTMQDDLGAPKHNAVVARNGVDLELFAYADENQQTAQQQKLGLKSSKMILSVGHLVERKGHHLIVDAMQHIDDCELWILGAGEMRNSLEQQIKKLGLEHKVKLLGEMTQPEMIQYYQSADCLVLASSREGWANVLLEAMACGTPVVATNIWGTPEVLPESDQQYLAPRSSDALGHAIQQRLSAPSNRAYYRQHAEKFSWQATVDLLKGVFENTIASGKKTVS
ncbi:glycosyltransferase [Echinimonas agarilytica]|uniref:Glycosyltransferase n=1 Tax=Echinimonas agarilytica TaxID=1215918 RepID=A0AA41W8W6_9GAMM|nr:glycosyltransferase [Echinimonas agarilytica]MCM2681477.1 glycosyltransferase [Echinimonas agarilytica]